MTSTRRAWLVATFAAGGALVALGLAALLQWSSLDTATRDQLIAAARDQAVLLALLVALLAAGAGLFAAWLVRSYEVPLRRLAVDVEVGSGLPAPVAPSPPGVRRLAAAVHALASAHAETQQQLDARVAQAQEDLRREHARLAALVSQLAVPVLVCRADGQILLYNNAAHELLDDGAGAVGLSRSVYDVIGRDLIAHALDRLQGAELRATVIGASRDGRLLRVRVGPVRGEEPYQGFVLSCEDMTTRAELSARRDAALRNLTEGTRAAAGAIRAAVESVLDYPDMGPAEQRRFTEVVRDETDRLGRLVGQVLDEAEADLVDRWLLEDVPGSVLLAAAARHAGVATSEVVSPGLTASAIDPSTFVAAGAAAATAARAEPAGMWLRVDSFAVVQAVVRLAAQIRDELSGTALRLDLTHEPAPGDVFAALDLRWEGRPLDTVTLRRWDEDAGLGLFDLAARHGGEVWPGNAGEAPYLRLLLPRVPGGPPARSTPPRPLFYDFSLVDAAPLPPEWEQRPLAEAAFTVIDTETTGLDPATDAVVSIGAVRVVRGRLLPGEAFEQLVHPGRAIPPSATAIHGITDDMVSGRPGLSEVLPRLARFAADTVLIGHDVAFDLAFLRNQPGDAWPDLPVLDTLLLAAVVDPDAGTHSLDVLAERFGLAVVDRHTAMGDAVLTAEVFLRLLPLLERRDLATVGAAVAASRRTPQFRRSQNMYDRS